MNPSNQLVQADIELARREFDDHVEFTADFGPAANASVDVFRGTVIVVTDDEQYELDVEGDAEAFMQNGVLTIEVSE